MSGKVFKLDKIAQCVQILDELGVSGQGTQAFAQARGLSYTQLRAWQNHERRWRERLAGHEPVKTVKPSTTCVRTSGFLQVHSARAGIPSVAPQHQGDAHSIRIECTHGARSATVYWPSSEPMQCAQWLAAYLA
jgi:hypothetical protein